MQSVTEFLLQLLLRVLLLRPLLLLLLLLLIGAQSILPDMALVPNPNSNPGAICSSLHRTITTTSILLFFFFFLSPTRFLLPPIPLPSGLTRIL